MLVESPSRKRPIDESRIGGIFVIIDFRLCYSPELNKVPLRVSVDRQLFSKYCAMSRSCNASTLARWFRPINSWPGNINGKIIGSESGSVTMLSSVGFFERLRLSDACFWRNFFLIRVTIVMQLSSCGRKSS